MSRLDHTTLQRFAARDGRFQECVKHGTSSERHRRPSSRSSSRSSRKIAEKIRATEVAIR
jgi:hypothetical protein